VKEKKWVRRLVMVWVAVLMVVPFFASVSYADFDTGNIRVNQIGYEPDADKIATVIIPSASASPSTPLSWQLLDYYNHVVMSGMTTNVGLDAASGDYVHKIDFSAFKAVGSDYKLAVDTLGTSVYFDIQPDLYPALPAEAMNYFYFHRMGDPTVAQYLPSAVYARAALHPGDSAVACLAITDSAAQKGCVGTLNVKNSWADAGDYGIYPVNHAISAWTLMNFFERYPSSFPDSSLNLPERGNGIPDILDEVAYGSTYMYGMLPATGLASHKVTNVQWGDGFNQTTAGFVNYENTSTALGGRKAQPTSTAATYAVARTMAQLSRVLKPYNATLAASYWAKAKDAFSRAATLPVIYYSGTTTDSVGGGDYDDVKITDDRYAAAVEMYLTAYKNADANLAAYRTEVRNAADFKKVGQFDWQEVATTGTLSLLSVPNDLTAAELNDMKANVATYASSLVAMQNAEGYPALLSPGASNQYPWGSNSFIVNRMMVLGYAYDLSKASGAPNLGYLKAINRGMDYLMGTNAMKLSYITGYGEYYEADTHDRFAWVASGKRTRTTPYPRGWLSGGPNNDVINDGIAGGTGRPGTPTGMPPAKSYAGPNSAPEAWASKENTINWNAPLVWAAQYIRNNQNDLYTGFSLTSSYGPSSAIRLTWLSQGTGYTYDVYVSDPSTGAMTLYGNVGASTTVDISRPSFVPYYFKVVAVNANPALNQTSRVLQASGYPTPAQPNIQILPGSSSIGLTFDMTGSTNVVMRSENNSTWTYLGDGVYGPSGGGYYLDSTVQLNKTYYYKVVATAYRYGSTDSAVVSGRTVAAATNYFATSLESGQTQTTWGDTAEASANIGGYLPTIQPEASVRYNELAKTGTAALMFSGKDNSTGSSYIRFKSFDVNIPVNDPNLKLNYWFYPQTALARNVIVDLVMTDGTLMSDCYGLSDAQGNGVEPSSGRGTVNAWTQVQFNFAPYVMGKTVDRILIHYKDWEYGGTTGSFRGYVDDIKVTN